jgi:hypothetical protein
MVAFTLPAMAGVNGAIYTTDSTGTTVNGNIYNAKGDVYLSGGPQNTHDSGLSPDGLYYFQVTDPSGAVLLSTDNIDCRMVTVADGRITGAAPAGANCSTGAHATGTFNAANGETPVQLLPFNDTPNSGGEYKAWMTPVAAYDNCSSKNANKSFGFCDSDSKTDNFKIKTAGIANVTVCKFNDWDNNGSQNDGEPFLEHWPITATGVDGGTKNAQTDDNGCVSFSISKFGEDGTATVTLTEGSEGPDWTQSAPVNGACGDNCNVAGGVITLTVKADDNISAPNFGNHDPNCTTGCYGNTLVVTKDANPSLKRTYTWGLTKTVDNDHANTSGSATFNYTVNVTHDAGTDSDWKVTGSIRVANPTGDDVSGINVSDALDNGGTCVVAYGPNGDGTGLTVEAGSHIDVPYTCTYSGAPAPSAGLNTATAAWGDTGVQNGTATFDFASATVAVVDDQATITDSLGGTLGTVSASDASPATFTYSQTFTDPAGTCTTHPNTATFTTNTTSATGSDSKSVQVCVGANLTISKTATPSFNSNITKSVDKTKVEQADGSATFNYTVTVTESGWNVAGDVTITNPNDWEAVTVNVADVFSDAGGNCSLASGTVTVAAGSTVTDHYICTFAAAPAAGGSNTANITWDAAAASTTGGAASATVSYTFQSLTINDTFKGTLGVIAPAASTDYHYSRLVQNATGGRCSTYDNTASIEGGASASQSVTICNTNTGALTIGFWQNKNGQGIITGSGPAIGVCTVGGWLRGNFAPFADLSGTATCAQVGTYVTNIIKAANASGASMNAMLKAQMLSTTLDVYFSTPGLGGNKIGAPTPIGTVNIDLTKVCNMLDGSSGTGTCSGSYANVGSAFGGATSMTVMNMLLFQNTVSNTGGTLWYGQVKSVQGLAKNAFDAINNRAAQIAP